MKFKILPLIMFIGLFACGNRESNQQPTDSLQIAPDSAEADIEPVSDGEEMESVEKYLVSESEITDSLLTINEPAAIIVELTAQQLDDMAKEYDEETFMTIMDDAGYYLSMATQAIDTLGIKNIQTQRRFIKLSGEKSWLLDVQKEEGGFWHLILFHPNKKPKIVPSINVDEALLKEYFDL